MLLIFYSLSMFQTRSQLVGVTSGQSYYAAGLIGRITSLTGPRPFVCLSVPYGFITRKWKGAEKLGLVGL